MMSEMSRNEKGRALFEDSSENEFDDEDSEDEETANVDVNRNERLCIICQANVAIVLYLPCRHQKTCTHCSSRMERLAEEKHELFKCLFCRQPVDSCIQAFV